MPIYEYLCEACGERTEILQHLSEQPLRECPRCHQLALKKLVSAAGFRLAGQGWYETDFKTQNQRNLAASQDPKAESAGDAAASKTKDASKKADASSAQTATAKGDAAKPQSTAAAKTAAKAATKTAAKTSH